MKDNGVDFLVEVKRGLSPSNRLFVVQVKGTTSPQSRDWMDDVKELYRLGEHSIYLPTCVFVLDVRDNRSLYPWIAEPLDEENGAKLRFLPPEDFHSLDEVAVGEIVDRIEAWYDVLPTQFIPR